MTPKPFKRSLRHSFLIKSKAVKDFYAKAPSNRFNNTASLIGIISGITSVALAIVSIWLTIQISKSKQQIQDLDRVLEQLVIANANQNTQLDELRNLSRQGLALVNRLDTSNQYLNDQLNAIRNETQNNQ